MLIFASLKYASQFEKSNLFTIFYIPKYSSKQISCFDIGKQNSSHNLSTYSTYPCLNDPTLRRRFATDAKKEKLFLHCKFALIKNVRYIPIFTIPLWIGSAGNLSRVNMKWIKLYFDIIYDSFDSAKKDLKVSYFPRL